MSPSLALLLCILARPALAEIPCTDLPDYGGWWCEDLLLENVRGTDFQVRARWNLPAGTGARAVVFWLAGGDGSTAHADIDLGNPGASDPRPLRDRLADVAIRSVEIQFRNPVTPGSDSGGGYWAGPREGFVKVAEAYLAALDRLTARHPGLTQDAGWRVQVGSSAGATAVAFALAWQDAGTRFDRVVLASGPFQTDLYRECADPSWPAFTGRQPDDGAHVGAAQIRDTLSVFNGIDDCTIVAQAASRESLLSDGARTHFPATVVSIMLGRQDVFGPWLNASATLWYTSLSAAPGGELRSFDDAGHDTLSDSAAGVDWLYQTLIEPPATRLRPVFADQFE